MATPLYIEEILELIITELASDNDKQSLARLARSCKAFTDPCLDSIWHTMDSFSPFIPLLPRSPSVSRQSVTPGFTCHVTENGTRLTVMLAAFGYTLRQMSITSETIIATFKKRISGSPPCARSTCFPDLRDLVWRMIYNDSLESWSLPPSLQSLTICQRPFTALDQVLDQVAHHCS
ncbi:hypothetical protein EDB19DRAFT_2036340 [Suillus lakei]|nr:hypothetical protein EDB19DRAFT_2036340 [Suillus lakei]